MAKPHLSIQSKTRGQAPSAHGTERSTAHGSNAQGGASNVRDPDDAPPKPLPKAQRPPADDRHAVLFDPAARRYGSGAAERPVPSIDRTAVAAERPTVDPVPSAVPNAHTRREATNAATLEDHKRAVPFKTRVYEKWFGEASHADGDVDRLHHAVVEADDPSGPGKARHGPNVVDGERLTRRRAFVPFQPAVRRRREPVKWVLSILSAVVFGALFGYILLWLWIGMDGTFARLPGRTGAPRAPEQGARVVDNGTNAGTQGASNVAPFVGSGMLPSQTFYAIQGGVFNDRASSEPLLKRAESESVPATLVEGEPLRLFYGVTYRLDDATELAAYYVGKGFDVYVRPYALSGGAIQATFDAEDASLIGSFLTHGLYLFDLSGRWTALGLHEPVVIDDASWKAFKETHGRFLEEGNRLKDRLNGAAGKDVETMTTALNQAVMGLVEYIKAPSEAYLLANEQARLDYFKALLAFYEHAVAR